MQLAILIPVFNRPRTLENCIRQLISQIEKLPSNSVVNVVVVDDGSDDDTAMLLAEKFTQVHVVKGTGNWWYTKSINEGIEFARGTLKPHSYLLLNDDVLLPPNFLSNVLGTLAKAGGQQIIFGCLLIDAAAPSKYLFTGYKKWISAMNKKIPYQVAELSAAKSKGHKLLPSMFLPGKGMFFNKNVFERNGLFSDKFPQYGSDFEYCLRAVKNGIRVVVSLENFLYSIKELTAEDSPVQNPTFFKFFKGLFRKHSSTYLMINARFVWEYGNKFLFPFTFIVIFLGKLKSYFNVKRHIS